jgi:hypothetical protein
LTGGQLPGKKLEGIAVDRLDCPHVPVVDRGALGDAEALGDGDNRGIRDTKGKPGVRPDELGDPRPVLLVGCSIFTSPATIESRNLASACAPT